MKRQSNKHAVRIQSLALKRFNFIQRAFEMLLQLNSTILGVLAWLIHCAADDFPLILGPDYERLFCDKNKCILREIQSF